MSGALRLVGPRSIRRFHFREIEPGPDRLAPRLLRRRPDPRLQLQTAAEFGGQRRQFKNALPIEIIAVVVNPNIGLILQSELDEFQSGPQVQSKSV